MRTKAKKRDVAILMLPVLLLAIYGVRFKSREDARQSAFMKKVRLDGLYAAQVTVLPNGWKDHQYVQFHKDETVTAASCDTPWLKYVAQKLNGYHHASYVVEDEKIQFSMLWPEYLNGQVDYRGQFDGQDLVLCRYNRMNSTQTVTRYKFIKLK